MEKISSILPTSPRVKKVDLSDAAPVRPGTPTFGRPVGANAVKDRLTISEQAKDIAFQETLGKIDPKEARGVRIAEKLTQKFFENGMAKDIKSRPASEQTYDRQTEIQDEVAGVVPQVDILPAKEKGETSMKEKLDVIA